jgi:peptide/nickel transport system substrate-binding protein
MVWRTVTEDLTRLAMLKRGEVDVAYSMRGTLGEEVKRTAGLKLVPTVISATQWLDFGPLAWDPKSPWHDRRVRLAAALAFDKNAINQAETLGHSKPTGSIIPSAFEYSLAIPPYPYDPGQSKKLLADAGYPNGFDAGDYFLDVAYANVQEAILNYLQQVGIRARLRPLERAAFFKGYTEKTFKNLSYTASGAFGNAATRLEAFVVAGGAYVYGSYPDIDGLFQEQASELDRKKREGVLHKIQQLVHEKAMFIPIGQLAFITGHGPRLEESGLGLLPGHTYSAPYEDVKLKGK